MLFPHTRVPGVELRACRVHGPEDLHRVLGGYDGLPSAEVLSQLLPEDPEEYAAQFTVVPDDSEEAVGVVGLHTLDLANGHVRAELFLLPAVDARTVAATAALTVNYAFSMFRIRKVYVWTVGGEARVFRDVPVETRNEGTLIEYVADGDGLHDVTVVAVDREAWDEGVAFLDELVGAEAPR
ncbi:hypothetical protein [Nocardiopsis quinghaiensis]|uniref:hypothetical protein n=1 Tax=Nocardiopsis quinghaiensis TaxID=464995 RepID=UPI00123BBC00|nr:hypothetical protein [Nocardiopsis quinghaiensis]